MIILGIDPGTAMLGYGVVERTGPRLRAIDYGVITTSAELPLPERLEAIYLAVTDLIELHAPALVGVERLFFTKNVQTAFAVGQARGVVLLAAAHARPGDPRGHAERGQGRDRRPRLGRARSRSSAWSRRSWACPSCPTPDDAADALAIAICVANRERSVSRIPVGALDRSALKPAPTRSHAVREGRSRGAAPRAARARAERAIRARAQVQDRLLGRRGRATVIASLDGLVSAVFADSLILEVGGVGLSRLLRPGRAVRRPERGSGRSSSPTTSSARTPRRSTASERPRSWASSACC